MTLLYGQLFALDKQSTLNIYHDMFLALTSKHMVSVYTEDSEIRNVFVLSKRITLTNKLENADIILITNEEVLEKVLHRGIGNKAILFGTQYRLLKSSQKIVGAFYWKKGRSQILFIKERLNAHHIHLPPKYKEYIVENL